MEEKSKTGASKKVETEKTELKKSVVDQLKENGSRKEKPKENKTEKEAKEKEKENEREASRVKQMNTFPRLTDGETHIETKKEIYQFQEELGRGTFGAVYRVCRQSDKSCFAMKCESIYVKKQVLEHEARILKTTNGLKSPHFVQMIDSGKVDERFMFIVLTLAGVNLWDLRLKQTEKKFTLNTSLKIAEQTLEGIRDLHRVGFLHRDIKPPNFAIGTDKERDFHTIYVLDFGLGRKICQKGKDLRTPRSTCAFRGTTRYAPLAAHNMIEQSRKDDLEAWWYMISEMIVFDIPWKQIKGADRDAVKAVKQSLRTDEKVLKDLFDGVCYEEMAEILKYLDSLSYNSIPDYDFIYKLVYRSAKIHKCSDKQAVDWDINHDYAGPRYKCGQLYLVKELQ